MKVARRQWCVCLIPGWNKQLNIWPVIVIGLGQQRVARSAYCDWYPGKEGGSREWAAVSHHHRAACLPVHLLGHSFCDRLSLRSDPRNSSLSVRQPSRFTGVGIPHTDSGLLLAPRCLMAATVLRHWTTGNETEMTVEFCHLESLCLCEGGHTSRTTLNQWAGITEYHMLKVANHQCLKLQLSVSASSNLQLT